MIPHHPNNDEDIERVRYVNSIHHCNVLSPHVNTYFVERPPSKKITARARIVSDLFIDCYTLFIIQIYMCL
jgi:hypothetical protein